jgi:hypothetical protein
MSYFMHDMAVIIVQQHVKAMMRKSQKKEPSFNPKKKQGEYSTN